jgi:hypothetical protein
MVIIDHVPVGANIAGWATEQQTAIVGEKATQEAALAAMRAPEACLLPLLDAIRVYAIGC